MWPDVLQEFLDGPPPSLLGLGQRPTMRRDVTRPAQHPQVRRVVRRAAPMQRTAVVDFQAP